MSFRSRLTSTFKSRPASRCDKKEKETSGIHRLQSLRPLLSEERSPVGPRDTIARSRAGGST
jgi:hypothetical protein